MFDRPAGGRGQPVEDVVRVGRRPVIDEVPAAVIREGLAAPVGPVLVQFMNNLCTE